jgi:hypothetical protein
MRRRPALVLALGLGLAAVSSGSLTPSPTEACCAAPRPEWPFVVTPDGTTIAAGDGFVMYLSSEGEQATITLVAETPSGAASNTPAAPAAVQLGRRALAPHVWVMEVPSSVRPGPYAVWSSPSPAEVARGVQAHRIAGLIIGTPPATTPLPAPAGHVSIMGSGGRGSGPSAQLVLTTPAPSDVGVVFEWTGRRGTHGSARWIHAGNPVAVMSQGRCGIAPFGAELPAAGTSIRAAFVDVRGHLGPWATLVVR